MIVPDESSLRHSVPAASLASASEDGLKYWTGGAEAYKNGEVLDSVLPEWRGLNV